MNDEEFDTYVADASRELEAKQQKLEDEYGIGHWARFHVDYEKSALQFFEGDALRAEAAIVMVGTHALAPGVFQWGWANKQLPEAVRTASERLKGLYELTGFDFFRNERGSSDEAMCWQTVAMACKFLGAQGVYPVPHGKVHSYLLLTEVQNVA